MRIILLFLVVITIFWLVKRLFFKPNEKTLKIEGGEVLVQCAYCQTHVPKTSAVHLNDRYYCNDDHAKHG